MADSLGDDPPPLRTGEPPVGLGSGGHRGSTRAAGIGEPDLEKQLRRELRQQARVLRVLIEALQVGILLQDRGHRVVAVNSTFVRMFGMSARPAELEGVAFDLAAGHFRHAFADPDGFERDAAARLAGGEPRLGDVLRLADHRILERDYLPVDLDGRSPGHLWVFRDVTDHAEAERALREQNAMLGELASLKTEFVATISHELRTPLTSIVSFASLLVEDAEQSLEDEQREFVNAINRNADRMLSLVEELLQLAKLESRSTALRFEPVGMPALIRATIANCEPVAHAVGVGLRSQVVDGPVLYGDESWLSRMAENLLVGAISATATGGTVGASAWFDADEFHFDVTDASTGLSPEQIQGLFTTFSERGYAGGNPTGRGLGLVISRAIVERHGGTIAVSSSPEVGTTVEVRLPVGSPAGPAGT